MEAVGSPIPMTFKLPGESRFRIYDPEEITKLLSEQSTFAPESIVDAFEINGTKGCKF
jgi:hypothetical protein